MTADEPRVMPRVGVSACLTGQPVRYDATHRQHRGLSTLLGPDAVWITVCPEMELGLGAPREMIRLVGVPGRVRLITAETRRDLTGAMTRWAEERVTALASSGLDGYVFKARSPSCGLGDVKLYESQDAGAAFERTGRGIFAAVLTARLPRLAVVEESSLDDAATAGQFVDAVLASARARLGASS